MPTQSQEEYDNENYPGMKYGCSSEVNETCDLLCECDDCCYSTNPNLKKFKEDALFRWNNDLD